MTPRAVAILLAGVAAAIFVVLVTTSVVDAKRKPEVAIRLWPGNSIAQAALADDLLAPGDRALVPRGRAAAASAIRQEPGNVIAARVMAMTAGYANKDDEARRWFAYGERYSRRDLPTQIALIELAVQNGDVAGALSHYDRALRTSKSIPQLLDVLIAAANEAPVRRDLVAMLKKRPPWRAAFFVQLLEGKAPPATVFALLAPLRLNPRDPGERDVLAEAIARLTGQGDVVRARALLPDRTPVLVRNAGFEGDNPYPPFDWRLASDADLNATIEPGTTGSGNVLYLQSSNGGGGVAAEQLLTLVPGSYRLSLTSGDIAGGEADRPRVVLACGPRTLLETPMPVSPSTGRRVVLPPVNIPAGCPGQRLSVVVRPTEENRARPWIDTVAISQLSDADRSGKPSLKR